MKLRHLLISLRAALVAASLHWRLRPQVAAAAQAVQAAGIKSAPAAISPPHALRLQILYTPHSRQPSAAAWPFIASQKIDIATEDFTNKMRQADAEGRGIAVSAAATDADTNIGQIAPEYAAAQTGSISRRCYYSPPASRLPLNTVSAAYDDDTALFRQPPRHARFTGMRHFAFCCAVIALAFSDLVIRISQRMPYHEESFHLYR